MKPLGPYTETTGDRFGKDFMLKSGVRTRTHQHPTSYNLAKVNLHVRNSTLFAFGNNYNDKDGYFPNRKFFDVRNDLPFINGFEMRGLNNQAIMRSVHNKALTKVNDKLNYAAGLFETWYERQKTVTLLEGRLKQLRTIVTSITNPKKAARLLKRKLSKAEASDIPSLWLEYNFAIMPLVFSVHDAVSLLSADMPTGYHRGRASASLNFEEKSDFITLFHGKYQVEHGVACVGFNANAVLRDGLGFDKPLTGAFAVIPWSWAVDYFVNVSEMLSNFEPRFPALQLADWYTTVTFKGTVSITTSTDYQSRGYSREVAGTFTSCVRSLSRPAFKFTINPSPLNLRRASYLSSAIALTAKGKFK